MTILTASDANIAHAAEAIRRGDLVAFPTETVYGLGADATGGTAVARIFETKGRPRFNPLIVHVSGLVAARGYGTLDERAEALAADFWPGALTLVVPKATDCPIADLATAGLETVALRVPAHPVAQALLNACGLPVAAPSANRSGHVSPTTAAHVAEDLGQGPAVILDGGATSLGLESTVVDMTGETPRLLRPGAIAREALEETIGPLLDAAPPGERPTSPGQLASHYAPSAALRLNARDVRPGEALLAFGPDIPAGAETMINLSETGDLREAAAALFAALRTLDATGAQSIAAMPIPSKGLGEAINDRLMRAAAPR